jgi:hypothetical protein
VIEILTGGDVWHERRNAPIRLVERLTAAPPKARVP